ncbi:MAG TPA: response regulator [Pirellulales bacterium]|nr:response regulator [Pirellulales bacterium]
MEARPTVFVVDDDQDVCDSVARAVGVLAVDVQCFLSPAGMLDFCRPEMTGCLILDIEMPGMNGLHLRKQLAAKGCQQPFIVMSGRADIASAVAAMHQGALDFIEKPFRRQHLLDRVQEAIARDAELRRLRGEQAAVRALVESLTARERQVLELVGTGKITKEIARDLTISHKTVEVHRSHIMKKMRVDSAADLLHLIAKYPVMPQSGGLN